MKNRDGDLAACARHEVDGYEDTFTNKASPHPRFADLAPQGEGQGGKHRARRYAGLSPYKGLRQKSGGLCKTAQTAPTRE